CHDRIEQAVQLLLSSAVQWLPDGTVQVKHPEQADGVYHLEETCACPDSAQAPRGWCVHRLAGAIAKRTAALVQARLQARYTASQSAPSVPLEEDSEVLGKTAIPAQYIQLINGKPFVRYAGLLAMAHECGLQKLEATFLSVTNRLAL